MQEGDVYLVEIPSSCGHEQAGPRPAITIQASGLERLPTDLIGKRRMKNKIGKIKQAKLELLKQSLKEIMGLSQ